MSDPGSRATGHCHRLDPSWRRIGVFGGTFDPVHYGHLVAARAVRDELELDAVLFVVSNDPWKKWGRKVTPASDRYAMVEAALRHEPDLVACDLEILRSGVSYTVDTLDELAVLYPSSTLYLVVGTDLLSEMETWDRAGHIAELAQVVTITRPGSPVPAGALARWKGRTVAAETPEISSTGLREKLYRGEAVTGLVPAAVERLIAERDLYSL